MGAQSQHNGQMSAHGQHNGQMSVQGKQNGCAGSAEWVFMLILSQHNSEPTNLNNTPEVLEYCF